MQANTTRALASPSAPNTLAVDPSRLPPNTRAIGLFLDSEHVGKVAGIIQVTKNADACGLLAQWRRNVQRFPFCVLAGPLGSRKGGLVGGLAANWPEALYLHAYARARLDDIAAHGTSFFSVWGYCLTDERRDLVLGIVAATQAVGGHA